MNARFSLTNLILYSLLFVFVVSFPISLLNLSPLANALVSIGFRGVLIAFYVYIINKNRIDLKGNHIKDCLIITLPCLLACVSNILAVAFTKGGHFLGYNSANNLSFILTIVLTIETAFLEETVFRLFIHSSLDIRKPILKILASAGIFGLMHLLNLIDARSVDAIIAVLEQALYTFGLGIILGFIYEFTNNFFACFIFHFLFNFINMDIFKYFGALVSDKAFYLTAVVITVIIIAYLAIIYFFYLKKKRYLY